MYQGNDDAVPLHIDHHPFYHLIDLLASSHEPFGIHAIHIQNKRIVISVTRSATSFAHVLWHAIQIYIWWIICWLARERKRDIKWHVNKWIEQTQCKETYNLFALNYLSAKFKNMMINNGWKEKIWHKKKLNKKKQISKGNVCICWKSHVFLGRWKKKIAITTATKIKTEKSLLS